MLFNSGGREWKQLSQAPGAGIGGSSEGREWSPGAYQPSLLLHLESGVDKTPDQDTEAREEEEAEDNSERSHADNNHDCQEEEAGRRRGEGRRE